MARAGSSIPRLISNWATSGESLALLLKLSMRPASRGLSRQRAFRNGSGRHRKATDLRAFRTSSGAARKSR